MIDYKGKIIVIAGPTASGKSDIALKLAKDIKGYIINGDSRQVYKDLNIGTAKPVFDKQLPNGIHLINGIKHFLYNFVNPKENYTIFEYQNAVKDILKKEKGIPILVGGTGMYIDSVIYNYDLTPSKNESLDLINKSIEQLQSLAKEFLKDMNESDSKNRHRLIRTIERGGVNRKKGNMLNSIYFVIDIDKEILKDRVKQRVDKMFEDGLLQENLSLIKKGYTYDDKGLNSIGYIEFKEYFEKKVSLDQVKEKIYINTLAYIKRQRTWFKRNKGSVWTNNYEEILSEASNFILKE